MLFDEAPKRRRSDLFDFDDQLSDFVKSIKEGARLVTISGLRRTGKSSLMLTGLSQLSQPFLVIDARQFAEVPVISRADFIVSIETTLNEFISKEKKWTKRVIDALKGVKGIEVSSSPPFTISLAWGTDRHRNSADLARLFRTLGDTAEDNHTRFVVAFDESQELRRLAGYDVSKLIAHIYDYAPAVQIVLTGSQVGFLYEFVGMENPKASLYGRARVDIETGRLTSPLAGDFLMRGMKQIGIDADENVIAKAIHKLDGIIGWLTFLGATARRTGKFNEKTIDKTLEEASKLAASEFQSFLELRPLARKRYIAILSLIAQRERASWSNIKRGVQLEEGRAIADNTFTGLLNNLVKASFVSKNDSLYSLSDSVLAHAILSGTKVFTR